ncbi:MAG: hypothetical protein ACPIOQ_27585, partial [Promethearchaeia archaeon]
MQVDSHDHAVQGGRGEIAPQDLPALAQIIFIGLSAVCVVYACIVFMSFCFSLCLSLFLSVCIDACMDAHEVYKCNTITTRERACART